MQQLGVRLAFQATTPAADGHSRERISFHSSWQAKKRVRSDVSVQQLLMEQNRLLMQQVQALQSQMAQSQQQNVVPASCDVPNRNYLDPRQCLEGVDPALKLVFEEFGKECKHLFAAWETQKALHEKYAKLTADGKIHKHFESKPPSNRSSQSSTLHKRNLCKVKREWLMITMIRISRHFVQSWDLPWMIETHGLYPKDFVSKTVEGAFADQTTCNQLVNVLEVKHGPEPEVPVTSIICTRCVFDLSMIFDLALANMRCPVFMCMWMLLAKATALRT